MKSQVYPQEYGALGGRKSSPFSADFVCIALVYCDAMAFHIVGSST